MDLENLNYPSHWQNGCQYSAVWEWDIFLLVISDVLTFTTWFWTERQDISIKMTWLPPIVFCQRFSYLQLELLFKPLTPGFIPSTFQCYTLCCYHLKVIEKLGYFNNSLENPCSTLYVRGLERENLKLSAWILTWPGLQANYFSLSGKSCFHSLLMMHEFVSTNSPWTPIICQVFF